MIKILANDGIDPAGKLLLENAGFRVDTVTIPQADLALKLQDYDAITVRSATKIRKELIDLIPNLKLIGRGGVGMDNIDVDYARSKGITVVNTPAASSVSVAELVFAHFLGGVRFLFDSNRQMPGGADKFNELKKKYAGGTELRGKTLAIIGLGRIGTEVAKIGLGLGMKVIGHDPFVKNLEINWQIAGQDLKVIINNLSLEEVLKKADFLSLHIPATADGKPLLGKLELMQIKKGAAVVNTSRGGLIEEEALEEALNQNHILFAGLDVFLNEPKPSDSLLKNPKISLSPHIGASTLEAQERIGNELAEIIIQHLT
jgi:D-3-phosphoglycerate dehydrogenase